MSLQNNTLLALAVGACLIGIGMSRLVTTGGAPARATSSLTVNPGNTHAVTSADESIPTLPTVHVSAQAPLHVLPRVTVRASAAERTAAALPGETQGRLEIAEAGSGAGDTGLSHVHLDMPYYSFGKILPRISKE